MFGRRNYTATGPLPVLAIAMLLLLPSFALANNHGAWSQGIAGFVQGCGESRQTRCGERVRSEIHRGTASAIGHRPIFRKSPFFREFFRDEIFRRYFRSPEQTKKFRQQGLGSGFIFDPVGTFSPTATLSGERTR